MKETIFNLAFYLKSMRKHWVQVAVFISCVLATVTVKTITLPPEYIARATFIFIGTSIPSPEIPEEANFYAATIRSPEINTIIKSQRMLSDVVEKFYPDLAYNLSSRQRLIDKLMLSLNLMATDEEKACVLEVKGDDPRLTAGIANFCLENISNINERLKISPLRTMIKVIDPAEPPMRPTNEALGKRLITAAVISFIAASGAIFLFEYLKEPGHNP
jgi:capsular polysaccharide biosynthesis protein